MSNDYHSTSETLSILINKVANEQNGRIIFDSIFTRYTPEIIEKETIDFLKRKDIIELERVIALQILNNLPVLARETIEIICFQLTHPNAFVRSKAAGVLGKRRDPFAIDPLIASFNFPGKDESIVAGLDDRQSGATNLAWEHAAKALGSFESLAVPNLLKAITNGDPHRRAWVCHALGYTSYTKEGMKVLLDRLLNDQEEQVRARAAWAIGRHMMPECISTLLIAQHDPASIVRIPVTYALGKLRQIEAIVTALSDPDKQVCVAALFSLATNFPEEAIPYLLLMQTDADEDVREEASYRLKMLEN